MIKTGKTIFKLTLHIQDDLKPITESGNVFLTNIHRVFFNEDPEQSFETTFLGVKPKPEADTSKGLDLGKVMRSDKIKDLVVLNDEAHHIHDSSLAWFKSIEDINNKLKLKNGNGIFKGRTLNIELTDFVTHYMQDDIDEQHQLMRSGTRVIIDNRQIIILEKDKSRIINRTLLTENW